jgi:hypothetical protein
MLENLKFDRQTIDQVCAILGAAGVLRKKLKITDTILDEFSNEQLYNIKILGYFPQCRKELLSKIGSFQSACSAFLNGADLHALGYTPGPAYGKILHAVKRGVWDGSLKNRHDAVAFITKTFHPWTTKQ